MFSFSFGARETGLSIKREEPEGGEGETEREREETRKRGRRKRRKGSHSKSGRVRECKDTTQLVEKLRERSER